MGKTGLGLTSGLIALLLAATIASGEPATETNAELLNRVKGAFRRYDTTDGTLKSLRMDVTMPMLGQSMRIRAAYQAPNRYSLVSMSADDLTPIAIVRERGSVFYNAAEGKALIDADSGAPSLTMDVGWMSNINFGWSLKHKPDDAGKT